jgi:hypothetical protein
VGGRGGLGVADLGGLVKPVSLVSSAVEAMLTLLCVEVVDKARNAGFEDVAVGDGSSPGDSPWSARVSKDSRRSICGLEDFL